MKRGALVIVSTLALLAACTSSASAVQFSSPAAIKMPDGENFLPYPSVIPVSGQGGTVTGVRVTLNQIAHGDIDEISALLVSPSGTSTLLLSRLCNGQSTLATPLTFAFDDAAPSGVSNTGPCSSGTFRPTADSDLSFPYPAPPEPHPVTLTALAGGDPNGLWQLFLRDSVGAVSGEVGGGWILDLTLTAPKTKKCKKPKGKRAAAAKKKKKKRCKKARR